MYSYFSVTLPPASSISFFKDSASALAIPSFTVFGADSTSAFASPRPRPVAFLTTLRTLILAAASKLSRITSNSVFSSAAPPSPPDGAAATATFTVGFSSAYDGKMFIGLTTTQTSELKEGRHVYDVNVKTGDTVYRIVEGQIMVRGGISSTL